jgi:hypothetical protein
MIMKNDFFSPTHKNTSSLYEIQGVEWRLVVSKFYYALSFNGIDKVASNG